MKVTGSLNSQVGVELSSRLGLQLSRREGHDLAGPCIACQSSDAFRLHQDTGVGYCYSCQGKWSPFQVAETVLQDHGRAVALLVELGVFQPSGVGCSMPAVSDPIEVIARQKGITPESLRAFGAHAVSNAVIELPAYGPDGNRCTTFSISTKVGTQGNKGLFAKGKPAGLFFPHTDSEVRLPKAGEVWHLVEGPKDAAALHSLGLLACGLNTCRLAAKFARLFARTNVVLIPDRDRAGEEGSQFSARVLRGMAKTVRIAVLPVEFKESGGEDVRDVLRRADGREQVLQAIADAQQPDEWDADSAVTGAPSVASAEIPLPEGDPLWLEVAPKRRSLQRLVTASRGEIEHLDRFNTDSSISRNRFIKNLAAKIGTSRDALATLVEPQLTKLADEIDREYSARADQDDGRPPSQATLVANMAANWEFWHTPSDEAYATIELAGHEENWPVRSQAFKRTLAKQFFDEQGSAISSESLASAVNLLEAKAICEGDEHPVYVRVAEHEGNIYLDLCNSGWQAVEITPEGWRVVDKPPIRFRRSRGMLALPAPERGGTVDQLRDFLNLGDDAWRLVISWLVATLRPRGPYPILALFAEQGSGKSTIGRLLRELVDPSAAPLRADPQNGRDLMIAAHNSWCLAYDNLSHIPPWLSDALCRLSTGGGFTTRELYTDQEETIFDSQRPLLLTSIEEVTSRSDLLDRCLVVWLSAIPEDKRQTEEELFDAFYKARPQILGALLDAVAVALRRLPMIKLPSLPRMADFALWAVAAEPAFGWPSGTFMAAHQNNRVSANGVALEASAIGPPLLELLRTEQEWNGSAGELLKLLEEREGEQVRKVAGWPKSARALSSQLARLAPNLRAAGWEIDQYRDSKKRSWAIRPLSHDANVIQPSLFASSDGRCDLMPSGADWCRQSCNDADVANAGVWNPDRY